MIEPIDQLDHPEELIALMVTLTEGRITPDQASRLEILITSSEQMKQFYVEYMSVHAMLQWQAGTVPTMSTPGELESFDFEALKSAPTSSSSHRRKIPWQRFAVAASILLLMSVFAALTMRTSVPDSFATIVSADGAFISEDGGSIHVGRRIGGNRIHLESGQMTVRFDKGARVVYPAPAEIELLDENLSYLHSGRARAYVPTEARGFTIRTPKMDVVDIGTAFGLSVDPEGAVEVHVFEGLVRLVQTGQKDPKPNLIAGHARRLEAGADAVRTIPVSERLFESDPAPVQAYHHNTKTPSSPSPLIGHWKFDSKDPQADAIGSHLIDLSKSVLGDGRFSDALMLDGSSDYAAIPANILGRRDRFTIALWIRTQETGEAKTYWKRPTLFGQGVAIAGAGDFGITTQAGQLGYWTGLATGLVDQQFESNQKINDGKWHMVIFRCDGQQTSLYLNGKLIPKSQRPAGQPIHARTAEAGALSSREAGTHHSGAIDDLGVWNQALSPVQIRLLFELARKDSFQYDLGQVQNVFDLHNAGTGNPRIGRYTWQTAQQMTSPIGTPVPDGQQIQIRLNEAGDGVIATPTSQ